MRPAGHAWRMSMRLGLMVPILLSLGVTVACGGKQDESKVEGNAASANNGSDGRGGGGLNFGTGGGANTGNGDGSGDAVDPNSACATSAAEGKPIPVDLYFMVDITGSM